MQKFGRIMFRLKALWREEKRLDCIKAGLDDLPEEWNIGDILGMNSSKSQKVVWKD
uniref:Uncharacterized protein n=1 Tax=Meloidogyne enterolobii TaxID=390850 RepID=A0A6V7TPX1_MELEN|nr:unnamed protein product [Meloidogyne enterolobii]